MKNQWKKKSRLKPFRPVKGSPSGVSKDGVLDGGAGMAGNRELRSIIEDMMKDIVDQGGTISLIMDDGRLVLRGEVVEDVRCGISAQVEVKP